MFDISYAETMGKENGLNQQTKYTGGIMENQEKSQGLYFYFRLYLSCVYLNG